MKFLGSSDEGERWTTEVRRQELYWQPRRSVCHHVRANRCPAKPRPVSETASAGRASDPSAVVPRSADEATEATVGGAPTATGVSG